MTLRSEIVGICRPPKDISVEYRNDMMLCSRDDDIPCLLTCIGPSFSVVGLCCRLHGCLFLSFFHEQFMLQSVVKLQGFSKARPIQRATRIPTPPLLKTWNGFRHLLWTPLVLNDYMTSYKVGGWLPPQIKLCLFVQCTSPITSLITLPPHWSMVTTYFVSLQFPAVGPTK